VTEPDEKPDPFEEKLALLPAAPGCYVFRDVRGEVLYVGKAKSLRSRVRSYFQASSSDTRAFLPLLRRQVSDFETIVTSSEKEATILENHLIKEQKPRYNVKLRDDKEYLSLRLSTVHEWPRLELVRRPARDGARYFGPYHSATAALRTLRVVEKHFKLRTCTDRDLMSRKRPCLEYQIKRCPGPCVLEVDKDAYGAQVRAVGLFLAGRHDELSRELDSRMREASERLEFELAATYRDQISAVESVRQSQRVALVSDCDQDVLGLYREGDLVELSLMVVRGGRVIDVGSFSNRRVEVPDDEVVSSFLREHYGEGGGAEALIPDEILLPLLPEGVEGVSEWLNERKQSLAAPGERKKKLEILQPMRGPRRGLLDMAQQNAEHAFKEKRRTHDDIEERLLRVQAKLRLPTVPHRIECVDISHLGGTDTVGAVVAFENGAPDKKRYRTYHVRGVSDGDDYAAMYQVLLRRFRRGQRAAIESAANKREAMPSSDILGSRDAGSASEVELEGEWDPSVTGEVPADATVNSEAGTDREAEPEPETEAEAESETEAEADPETEAEAESETEAEADPETETEADRETETDSTAWDLPDLFVVDGGRGQLAVALTAAHDLGLHDLSIVGLAKERESVLGDKMVDRVYLPGQKNPIPLRPNSPELFMLANARDEAHRFSNRGRKSAGKRRSFASELEALPGLGPKTRAALLKHFGSLTAIHAASEEALLAVPRVTRRHVEALLALRVSKTKVSEPD
jgi:excinuclease ABC subunit C